MKMRGTDLGERPDMTSYPYSARGGFLWVTQSFRMTLRSELCTSVELLL